MCKQTPYRVQVSILKQILYDYIQLHQYFFSLNLNNHFLRLFFAFSIEPNHS